MDRKYCKMLQDGVDRKQIVEIYKRDTGSTAKYKTIVDGIIRQIRKDKAKEKLGEQIYDKSPEVEVNRLVGLTAQRDKQGNIVQFWTKTKPEEIDPRIALLEAIEKITPLAPVIVPIYKESENLLEIPLFDMHYGISSLEYYSKHLVEILELIQSKHWDKIIFVVGQDLLHVDNHKNETSNGTVVEAIDLEKAFDDACKFYTTLLNSANRQANSIDVVYSRGNHDEDMAWALVKGLQMKYSEYDKITFDTSMRDIKVNVYGKCFMAWSHSDKGKKRKPKDVRGAVQENFKDEWYNTNIRELHIGHLHTEEDIDAYGLRVRGLSTANKTDEWHIENDFVGNHKRFMVFEWTKKKLKAIYFI